MRPGPGPSKVWYLRRLDLFLSLTDVQIDAVARLLDDESIPAGAELLRDRQRERLHLVKEGAVRLYAEEGGQRSTLALLGPGRLFGLSAAFGDARPTIGAVTLEPSYVCFATWQKLLHLFEQHPAVMARLTQALLEQIFYAETWLERQHGTAPRVRLAMTLLELADQFGVPAADGVRIRFRLTQADLARMINTSRETVSRVMAEFLREGWVGRAEGRLVVRERQPLERLVEGGRPAPTEA